MTDLSPDLPMIFPSCKTDLLLAMNKEPKKLSNVDLPLSTAGVPRMGRARLEMRGDLRAPRRVEEEAVWYGKGWQGRPGNRGNEPPPSPSPHLSTLPPPHGRRGQQYALPFNAHCQTYPPSLVPAFKSTATSTSL